MSNKNMYMTIKHNVAYIHIFLIYSMNYIINFFKDVEKTKHVHDYNVHDPNPSHPTPPWWVAST